jgi:hypothetical protein
MNVPTPGDDFLKDLRDSHGGQALIEIDRRQSEVRFKDAKPIYLEVMIRLFLEVPMRIGALYRMEACGDATYDMDRHGRLSWTGACIFVLRRALDKANPGASSLLDFDLPAITANRIRRVLTEVNEEPLLFQVKLPENWS